MPKLIKNEKNSTSGILTSLQDSNKFLPNLLLLLKFVNPVSATDESERSLGDTFAITFGALGGTIILACFFLTIIAMCRDICYEEQQRKNELLLQTTEETPPATEIIISNQPPQRENSNDAPESPFSLSNQQF